MATRIPATVITGFLGAGKTSLIRHMIENNRGKRLAFLINEFGDLGIDRELLLGCGIEGCDEDDVVELSNGCICCTVADDFLPAIEAILARPNPPDHILIETSGLALPKPLVKAFSWPEVKARITVDGVITVVDSKAFSEGRFADDEAAVQAQREADESLDHDNPLEEVFEDQLLCADMVILNKLDLLEDGVADRIQVELAAHMRPGVRFVHAREAAVDPVVMLGLDAKAEDDLANRPSHHDDHGDGEDDHDHDDFDSFTLRLSSVADADALEARILKAVGDHDILRVKGFLDRPGVARREVVQAVGPRLRRYFDRAWRPDETRQSELVIIGLKGLDQDAISRAILG
ncbi:MAG: cobalamin biosynthesis protein CobW [Rhodospirillaceae bacterium]|jgi:cobalamin biosynthesis protein CobW|uniref:cobalamin biosynthesis protein CobW n=1 Tax=unclassified Hwanghaeella TaxID=2605944 RepID=UPI000C499AAD|nr:cobalamin biosynthesis protein CobW [Rhodospirillales bacterium]MAX48505.1 cobalamin biosynthesis protein CobW [Rhodospirillaceae bacterium]|tara:strand:+ start:246 stop:1286 length:1041 start_codon:yes stop_codon:yes gene_type:complete